MKNKPDFSKFKKRAEKTEQIKRDKPMFYRDSPLKSWNPIVEYSQRIEERINNK